MSTYFLYPEKDTSIYSKKPNLNTGLDEILEIGDTYEDGKIETLISFPQEEIINVINKISGSYECYLNLYIANGHSIPLNYTVHSNPIAFSWKMGTGRYNNNPPVGDGTTYNTFYGNTQIITVPESQSFDYNSNKNINIKTSNPENNLGYKLSIETDVIDPEFRLQYFSSDTHTIYPPTLQFKWDDSIWNPLVDVETITNLSESIVVVKNNKVDYHMDDEVKFYLAVKPYHPRRTFSTSSIYNKNYLLPIESFYEIRDLKSNEIIIPFSEYTKISADINGCYFKLFMNSFQPERYYKIVTKSTLLGQTVVFDGDDFFQVKNEVKFN